MGKRKRKRKRLTTEDKKRHIWEDERDAKEYRRKDEV